MNVRHIAAGLQRFVRAADGGVTVLAYHLVDAGTDAAVDLPLPTFVRQLDDVAARFEIVPLSQALVRLTAAGERPLAVLTFDDGYANFYERIWPLLQARRLPSVFYVPVGFIRGDAPPPLRGADLPPCTWDHLRELTRAGVEIGSHGLQHVDLRALAPAALERDLVESRDMLEQRLGAAVTSFCYPRARHDQRTKAAVRSHYLNATVAGGRRYHGEDAYCVRRFPVRRDDARFDTMLRTSVWLSEAVADRVRCWRH